MKIRTDPADRPDFIIIGAMKCATSTLHEQLAMQPGFFMTEPKEPNFFSDDAIYVNGLGWYAELFSEVQAGQLKGESSTHYSKLPTYPETINRLVSFCPDVKLIYVMRHPVDRLISHYIHEWTQGVIDCDINKAVHAFPELVDYGRYSMQIEPYLSTFGAAAVQPLFAERLRCDPLGELQKVFSFLGVQDEPVWHQEISSNVSAERIRVCGWRDAIVDNPVARGFRRALVPKKIRTWIRGLWAMKERPSLSPESLRYVEEIFDRDLQKLGALLGVELTCRNFKETVLSHKHLTWVTDR